MSDYKLVPVVPTHEMKKAARKYQRTDYACDPLGDPFSFYVGIYRAMLSASPPAAYVPAGELRELVKTWRETGWTLCYRDLEDLIDRHCTPESPVQKQEL